MANLETPLSSNAEDMQFLSDWLDENSGLYTYGDGSTEPKGRYASVVLSNFDKSPIQVLRRAPAEGALVLFADERICDGIYPPSVSLETPSHQREWLDRVNHLVFKSDCELPPVTLVGLLRDDTSIRKQVKAALADAGKVSPPGVPVIAVSLSGVAASTRKRLSLPSVPTHIAIAAWEAKRAAEEAKRAKMIAKGQDPDGGLKWRPNGTERLSERIAACTICGRPKGHTHTVMCDRAWKLAGADRRVNAGDCLSDALRAQGGSISFGWPT